MTFVIKPNIGVNYPESNGDDTTKISRLWNEGTRRWRAAMNYPARLPDISIVARPGRILQLSASRARALLSSPALTFRRLFISPSSIVFFIFCVHHHFKSIASCCWYPFTFFYFRAFSSSVSRFVVSWGFVVLVFIPN